MYDTLTRQFQDWRRYKSFWSGQFAEGHDPGLTYDRDRVEVAVKITAPSEAIDEEARLIRSLKTSRSQPARARRMRRYSAVSAGGRAPTSRR